MLFEKKQPVPEDEKATLRTDLYDGKPPADEYREENPFEGKEGVEIRYNLNAEEARKGLLLLQKEQIFKRNLVYTGLLAVLFVLYLIAVIRDPNYSMGMVMLALSAGVIALIWMMAWRYRSSQAKAVATVKEDFNMTVFDSGILVHQENGDFRALFSEPRFRVKELEEMFILDLNRQRVYILPKRCMDSAQVTALQQHFAGNMNTQAEK